MNTTPFRLGLISALPEEQAGLIHAMKDVRQLTRGMRNYAVGSLWGVECICVLSRVGKAAAAATTATLIDYFNVTHIVFTGVAGSGDAAVRVGDIVIADALLQHDMDASPLFPRFEVPLLGRARFDADPYLVEHLALAARAFVAEDLAGAISAADRATFRLDRPGVHLGLVASGDEFIQERQKIAGLKRALPDLRAVEMEGAAVAQVCFEFNIPCAVIRTISDSADDGAAVDFMRFIERVASSYAFNVMRRTLTQIAAQRSAAARGGAPAPAQPPACAACGRAA